MAYVTASVADLVCLCSSACASGSSSRASSASGTTAAIVRLWCAEETTPPWLGRGHIYRGASSGTEVGRRIRRSIFCGRIGG
mmetsp:Transcript_34468/g.91660  ORF Transcript_34468/g.91660 Transcript_34468/m.91660 type:complete len:82 (+) Transcript_34468:1012-1257(+)